MINRPEVTSRQAVVDFIMTWTKDAGSPIGDLAFQGLSTLLNGFALDCAAEGARQAERDAARRIRGELVCCDSYDVHRPNALTDAADPHYDPETQPGYHAVCYWGEAAARLAEDVEDCEHEGGSWFDRMICPEPCNTMHDRCQDCGQPLDACPNRATSYFNGISVVHVIVDEAQDVPGDFFEEDEPVADVVAAFDDAAHAELRQLRAEVQRLRDENDDLRDAMRHGMGLD